MAPIFSLDTYSLDRLPISKSTKGNTSTLSENWRLFAPRAEEKALHFAALGQSHDHLQARTSPFWLLWKWKGVAYIYYYSIGRDLPKLLV